ncbi:magnesium chelatase subunit D [Methylobacterium sp. J-078]|uniref:magnesium chelatase subunit D n=1 Tax=Methylobacterium sp. J-078 TaxID=2836657 RepID=UPI001FB9AE9E|nr:magnesium chelatase subunit D [Methylobacterium sp. J-078]MCJ2046934.1 magnesium chelatase subunit D [Methylobacterium sp. J-078]
MSTPWSRALRVADLTAADPVGCGGVVIRAGAGPVRDLWLDHLRGRLRPGTPLRRMPAGIPDDRLLGGIDLAATLAAGRPVTEAGLLSEADGGLLVVPMAERLTPGTAARLAGALDTGRVPGGAPARFGLILLDEGTGDDERVPDALADRLAFHLDLTGIALGETRGAFDDRDPSEVDEARPVDAAVADLCRAAAGLGILSLRAPLLAMRVAHRLAAEAGRATLAGDDVREAARLVLAPRAMRMPPVAEETREAPPETAPGEAAPDPAEAGDTSEPDGTAEDGDTPEAGGRMDAQAQSVVEAARAAIPAGLLAGFAAAGARTPPPRAGKAGALLKSVRSGRPAGTRPGHPRAGRLALIDTLRAAAPWQRLRAAEGGAGPAFRVRASDVRITRFRQRGETTTIFAVDASGSAALERLAEAKGAVELLLAEAYIRRDRVALVAFRGTGAEIVLAPTRALARARRDLAALPGGGGTPLASGLYAAADLARTVIRAGGAATLVVLTDGRANVTRAGMPGRAQAGADALDAAALLRAHAIRSILIDTAARPQDSARRLAEAMGARYLPLPYADATAMSRAIRAVG